MPGASDFFRASTSAAPANPECMPGEARSASRTAESPVTRAAEWLVTNDSNRSSRLSLSLLTTQSCQVRWSSRAGIAPPKPIRLQVPPKR
jgi:hypothetical protein